MLYIYLTLVFFSLLCCIPDYMTEIHLLWAAQNGIWTPKPYFQFLNKEVPFLFPNKDFAGFWTEPQTLTAMGSQHKLHYLGMDLLCSLFRRLLLHFISPGENIPCHSPPGASHHWQAVVRKSGFNILALEFPIRRKKASLSSK